MIRPFDEPSGKNPIESGAQSLLNYIDLALSSKSLHPSAKAQELFYQAIDASTDKQELLLLEKALKLDPGNVDALLAMFCREEFSDDEAILFLHKLVKLAEARLGRKAFEKFSGHFWGFHETRPYMRVREMLAEHLRAAGKLDEAVAEWGAMLELNPGDNQGVRYSLLPTLLILGRLDEAGKLFEMFPEEYEWNAVFAWGRTLERFLSDDLPGATASLAVALKQNPHMQAYVKGRKIPKTVPNYYSSGSKEEAICFAADVRDAWEKHPAALKWLGNETKKGK